ncbi:hypothetical protein AWB81_07877 [Caballeronia arationis]|nr:hypothetical protein AWB81_07877 [Caballeronia arationis]
MQFVDPANQQLLGFSYRSIPVEDSDLAAFDVIAKALP